MRRWWSVPVLLALLAGGGAVVAPSAPAATGTMTEVTDFGTNPGELQMFAYVPADLPRGAPLVVVMHGCLSQVTNYDDETGWLQLADARKWALVFPQQAITNNTNLCLNWVSEDDIARGKGEARSIVSMVDWMWRTHGVDAARIWATGHSAGGYFTSVLLATYPDLFKAGASVSGGPYRCETYQHVYLAPPGTYVDSSANEFAARGACTQAGIDRTPEEWGHLLRSGAPRYTGPKPPVSLWHGSADDVVVPKNFEELVEQWTDYHGIDRSPEVADDVAGHPHRIYADRTGRPLVETYLLTDRGHSFPGDGSAGCPGQENAGICAVARIADWFEASAARARR